MTTSNDTIYQVGRDVIITAALRKLGRIAKGQAPDADDIADASIALNMLVAELRTIGMPLWARKTYSFYPVANQQIYQIGIGKLFNTAYPLHMLQAYRVDSTSNTKVDIQVVPNYNFNLYPTNSGGNPIQLSYQPFVDYGEISLWPIPDSNAQTNTNITVVYQAPYQYFDAALDTMDFPNEWYNAIVYGLADLLAPEWSVPLQDRQMLASQYEKHLEKAKDGGQEDGSWFMQPTRRRQ